MDSMATMERVVGQARQVVNGVTADQLGNPTLCTEWTVRDIINHITGGAKYFGMVADQGSVSDEVMGQLLGDGDVIGDDYKGAFNAACDEFFTAFRQPGVLDKTVKLPFGEVPASVALNIGIFDVSTHTCDIAEATGQKVDDTELLETALEVGRQLVQPEMRDGGMFKPEKPCTDAAPADQRLLAFAGRAV
jgi:uncharacterized protein (TIGR03086 family)